MVMAWATDSYCLAATRLQRHYKCLQINTPKRISHTVLRILEHKIQDGRTKYRVKFKKHVSKQRPPGMWLIDSKSTGAEEVLKNYRMENRLRQFSRAHQMELLQPGTEERKR